MKFACMLKVFCLSLILVFTILIGTQCNTAKGDTVHNCNETEISQVDPEMFKRCIEIYTQLLQNYSSSELVRDDFEPENRICYLLEGMHRACEEVVTENCDASLVSNKCGEREPDALKNVNRSVQTEEQSTNMKLEAVLARIQNILNTTQPEEGDHRCGNPAFITFVTKIAKMNNDDLLMSGEEEKKYLYNSFGNINRIDYGTGHELNFLCYLYVLCEKKLIGIAEVFKTLDHYFDLVREIIVKYKLEPAGSHGAWGIDDYQILPFLLGSSELCNSQLTFNDLLNQECKYVYAKAICFVNRQKTKYRMVPFKTHSPMVYGISQKKWAFVNFELMDRYRMDVLDSRAVNQHFIYSSFLPNEQCNNTNQFEE